MWKAACPPIALAVIVIGLLSDPAPLWAQAPQPVGDSIASTREEDKPWNRTTTPEIRDAAKALFEEGNRLFRIPLFQQAAAKYAVALGTYQHPAIYYNLALAQLNLGQDVAARENLERALRYGDDPLGAAEFEEGQHQLRELERQLGRIRVTCQTPGAVVTLDGVALFTAPGSHTAWVMPQAHEITARKQDYLSESRQVTAASGTLEQLELTLITLEAAADASRRWATWKPWTLVAAGGAIAAGGAALHALSSRNFNAYDEGLLRLSCTSQSDGDPMRGCREGQIPGELNDRLTRARQQQTLAIGSYIAGGSAVAAGIVLLYLNRPRLAEQRTPSSPHQRVAVVPALSGDMVGILVSVDQ